MSAKRLSRYRDLGHLERDVTPAADPLPAILISFSRRLTDHRYAVFGYRRVRNVDFLTN